MSEEEQAAPQAEQRQIIICTSAGDMAVVSAVLTGAECVLWNQAADFDAAQCTGQDIVLFAEVGAPIIWAAEPSRLRVCTEPIPANFSADWARSNLHMYPPEKPELRAVSPYNPESEAQTAATARSASWRTGPSPVPLPPSSDASDPTDIDIEAITGTSQSESIGEPPEYLDDAPDDDSAPSKGIISESDKGIKATNSETRYWQNQQREWADPLDIFRQITAPPEFDTSVFTDKLSFLDTFCSDISELKGTDYGIASMAAIVSLSAWVHESWRLQVKSRDSTWKEAARLWGFVCGSSSDGKSVGLNLGTEPARQLDARAGKEAAVKLAKYASDLRIREKQMAEYEKQCADGKPATMPPEVESIEIDKRLFREANPEGLRTLLETTPKGWLYTDELSAWVANMGKYSANKDAALGERSQWLQAWDGGAYTVLRGPKAIHIDSWSSCILGGVTNESLRSSLGANKLQGDGLIQRFMVYHTRHQRQDVDRERDQAALLTMQSSLNALRHMRPYGDKPLRLAPDAYDYLKTFIQRLTDQADSGQWHAACESHILKFRSNAPRLALVLHLTMRAATGTECHEGEYIELPILQMACDVCEQLLPHTTYFWESVIGEGQKEIDADLYQICEAIACWHLENDRITPSQIGQSFRQWNKASYDNRKKAGILSALQQMNWIGFNPGCRTIAPGINDSYRLHPALRRMFDSHPLIVSARVRRMKVGAKFREMRRVAAEDRLSA